MTEKVLGLGGISIKAKDPVTLATWYRDGLGLNLDDFGGMFFVKFRINVDAADDQAFSLFPESSEYFPNKSMINFRVADLDKMLAQLRQIGADVDENIDDSEFGRFGWVTDPEGNRIELWQSSKQV